MADWCTMTGFGPDLYKSLSILELNEFYEHALRIRKAQQGMR